MIFAQYGLLIILAVLFALNMGGSNFGASFAAAHGGRIITKRKAQLLFIVFVFLGALLMGRPVSETIGNRLIPPGLITFDNLLIIFTGTTFSLFIANKLGVPQSTSLVTVASVLGVGAYFNAVYLKTLLYLVPFWFLLPAAGYLLTLFLGRFIYPPRQSNFWIYEKLVHHKKRLLGFVIIASCYNAFSIGANNVANAAGPLFGAGVMDKTLGLILIAPIFGLGSVAFSKSLKTAGGKIVPLGLLSATIICVVTGTLMLTASLLGVPQSFVMIKVAAIFAIGGLKNGHRSTFLNPATKKTYYSWLVTPIVVFGLSLGLCWIKDILFV